MERLKQLRKKNKMTQQQVADLLHIPRTTYTHYESGITEMDYSLLCKTADLFDVSVDTIIDRNYDENFFENSRLQRPEIIELYEQMTIDEREHLVHYAKGIIAARKL